METEKTTINTVTEIFVDGIDNLSLTAGTFRFDLVTIDSSSLETDKDGKITSKDQNLRRSLNRQARVVMTPQGFSQTLRAFNSLLEKAEKEGLITRQNPNAKDDSKK